MLRKFGVCVVVENRGEAGHVAAAGLDMQGPRRWSEPSAVLILADVRRLQGCVKPVLLLHSTTELTELNIDRGFDRADDIL
jgi:hypothetical protein